MATDIAFAVGILTLLGRRVPAALRVLLLALAVIDDLGAIVVIALFYSSGVAISGLLVAAGGFAAVLLLQRMGVRAKLAYVVPSLVAWAGIYAAGIHPTIAGVIVGLLTPVTAWLGPEGFVTRARRELEHLESSDPPSLSAHELAGRLHQVDLARREALSPAEHLIELLHPWVAFVIMPVFALVNAGVVLDRGSLNAGSWQVSFGVTLGLLLGKPVGVLLGCWAVLKTGLGRLPAGVTLRHLVVLGTVAGVGFTMALFIADLAFADAGLLSGAKLAILAASLAASVVALVLGRLLLSSSSTAKVALTADEAERSTEL